MLELSAGLSGRALDAIAELERRTVAADGGRLKLEWGTLRTRPPGSVHDVLWWEGDRLAGFLGLYDFGAGNVELAGMVDPELRRRGIGRALLDSAAALVAERGYERALLIVPRHSTAGAALARRRGAELEHSEIAMVLEGEPVGAPLDPQLRVRDAQQDDLGYLTDLLHEAFGYRPDPASILEVTDGRTVVVELDGQPVGGARLTLPGDDGGAIHGFAVAVQRRGQGIGGQALGEFCRMLRGAGARTVRLEVAVDNDQALRVYTSVGFQPVIVEDYYLLPRPTVAIARLRRNPQAQG